MNSEAQVGMRAERLRSSLAQAEAAWGDGSPRDPVRLFETAISDTNQLRKALLSPHLPPELQAARFDDDLDERVRHTRNLWEHWEDPSLRTRHPGRNPWVVERVAGGDFSISGVVLVSEIKDALENVYKALFALDRTDQQRPPSPQ